MRHGQAAVADEGHDRAIAMDERGGDGGRQPVPHRARGRAEERPGTPEPEPATGPTGEVAGVGGQDRVVRRARAAASRSSDRDGRPGRPTAARRRSTLPPTPRGPPRCAPGASRRARRRARPGRGGVRSRALRKAFASAVTAIVGLVDPAGAPGTMSTCAQAQARPRHRVAVGRRLVEPRAEHEQRVGRVEPLPDRCGGAETGHPEEQRVVVGDDVGTPPGRDDRDLQQFREPGQLRGGPAREGRRRRRG